MSSSTSSSTSGPSTTTGMLSNTIRIAVEWSHCDPARIVYYPHYFTWFDHGTRHLFAAAGLTYEAMLDEYDTLGMPLVDARAEFILPTRFGDTIEVTSRIAEWRRKTVVIAHEVAKEGALCVRGQEIRIWGAPHPDDPTRLVAKEIPADFRARFVV